MRRAAAGLALIGLLLVPSAPAAAAPRGLRFAEASLATTGDALRAGVKVTILNDTSKTLTAHVKLGDLSFKSGARPPAALATADVIDYPTGALSVPAAGERPVDLSSSDVSGVADGRYTGRLAVYDDATGVVARIPVTVQVGAEAVMATAAVKSLVGRYDRHRPFSGAAKVELPIDVRKGKPTLTAGASLGVLSGNEGGVAEATLADGRLDPLGTGVSTTTVTIRGIDRQGVYKGTLALTPQAKAAAVELTVDAQEWWPWPALALLIGIGIALYLRHVRGVLRPGLALLLDETETAQALEQAEKQFAKDAERRPWAAYDAKDAIRAAAKEIRGELETLGRTSFDELDEDRRKQLVASLAAIEAYGPKLKALPAAFAALQTALAEVDGVPAVDDLPATKVPPLFAQGAASLLRGRRLGSLAELDALVASVAEATALALRWPMLHAEAEQAAARIDAAAARAEGDAHATAVVDAARRRLAGAWLMLSEAEDAGAVSERRLIERFHAAIELAAGTAAIATPQRRRERVLSGADGGTAAIEPSVAMPALTFDGIVARLPESLAARRRALRRAIGGADVLQMTFAGAVALYTGLEALYWDKHFGGWHDYLAALLWGSVTAGALDALVDAIRTRVAAPGP